RYDQPWVGDAVEFFLDLRPADQLGKADYAEGVFQFFFIPADERTTQPTWLLSKPRTPFSSDLALSSRRTPQGYALEVRIPWRSFGAYAPKPGSAVGLDLGLDDVDIAQATERKAQMMWAGTSRNFVDASGFARGRLALPPSASAPAEPTRVNLLPNPSFEIDLDSDDALTVKDGWREMLADWKDTTGSCLWDRSVARTGRASASIRGVTTHRTWESPPIPVSNDTAYRASVWAKTQNLGQGQARLFVACFNADGKWVGNAATSANAADNSDWQQLTAQVPAGKLPAGTTVVRIDLGLRGPTQGTVWFDDAAFGVE
ncbi:MAG: hypothetical protein FJ272_06325, partial [Planctomycetes bacterium]|nr:hypothetical protein [Planctomycetota bacterium]